jgi:hypothetical protein
MKCKLVIKTNSLVDFVKAFKSLNGVLKEMGILDLQLKNLNELDLYKYTTENVKMKIKR